MVARNGPKFHKSETEGDAKQESAGKAWATKFERFSMARFAQIMDPPVSSLVDETGLTGAFDFTLDLSPYILDPATGTQILGSRQLGLRLEPKTAPLEVMVIDHVEKDPTAN